VGFDAVRTVAVSEENESLTSERRVACTRSSLGKNSMAATVLGFYVVCFSCTEQVFDVHPVLGAETALNVQSSVLYKKLQSN
jgi:hypothetical protein